MDEAAGRDISLLRRLSSTQFSSDWAVDDDVRPTEEWDGWARGLGGGGGGSSLGERGSEGATDDLGFGGSRQQRDEAGLLEEMLCRSGFEAIVGNQEQLFKIAERQVRIFLACRLVRGRSRLGTGAKEF